MSTQWRPVVGYEGRYEVSDDGQVKSLASGDRFRRKSDLILKQFLTGRDERKYPSVNLCSDAGSVRTRYVHQLVAAAFLGPIPAGALVLHYDDDQMNNHLSNLRFGTLSDNQQDAVRNGRHRETKKTHCLHGHPLSGRNLIVRRRGRGCRECERQRDRVRYARSKGLVAA